MQKVIYVRVRPNVNRFSGYSVMVDVCNGYGWRYAAWGSWDVFVRWLASQDADEFRVFVSGR